MKRRTTASSLLVILSGLAPLAGAHDAGAANRDETCVEVEVDGSRALSINCLNQRLSPTLSPLPPSARMPTSEALFAQPGNRVGLFNRAALSNSMGNTFGKSAFPQRPAPIQPVNPFNRGAP